MPAGWILFISAVSKELQFILSGVDIFQVTKNAILCMSVDELLEKGRDNVKPEALAEIVQKVRYVTYFFNSHIDYMFYFLLGSDNSCQQRCLMLIS